MIDFHSHILPHIDDGSRSPEQTQQMLKCAAEQGVRYIVATPHFYADQMTPDVFLQNRQRVLESVAIPEGVPELGLGAEVYYFDNMSRSEQMQKLQINDTGLLLVEMPFSGWNDRIVKDVCALQDRQGLTPVLAHIERYRNRDQFPRYWEMLMSEGALFQCNAASFGHWRTGGWLLKLVKAGRIHFLGSDCHNMTTRPPNMEVAACTIEKRLGREVLQSITDFSAKALGI